MTGRLNQLKKRTEKLLEAVAAEESTKSDSARFDELVDPQALEGLDAVELVSRYLEAVRLTSKE